MAKTRSLARHEVQEIRALGDRGAKPHTIAERFRCDVRQVTGILNSWQRNPKRNQRLRMPAPPPMPPPSPSGRPPSLKDKARIKTQIEHDKLMLAREKELELASFKANLDLKYFQRTRQLEALAERRLTDVDFQGFEIVRDRP